jgi:BlaI family transcriptional regulator, penicillinase repressor
LRSMLVRLAFDVADHLDVGWRRPVVEKIIRKSLDNLGLWRIYSLMPRKPSSQPNEVEMQILTALWELGPSSARKVHNALAAERKTAYASTVKMLHVMTEKGLLIQDDSQRPQLFRPASPPEKMRARLVRDLIHRVFGGALTKLVQSAVSSQEVSPEELKEMKRIIRKVESGGGEASEEL